MAGALSLRVSTARSWRFLVYVVSLVALWLFLSGAVAVDWLGILAATRSMRAYWVLVFTCCGAVPGLGCGCAPKAAAGDLGTSMMWASR
jgi:hypothetical protein